MLVLIFLEKGCEVRLVLRLRLPDGVFHSIPSESACFLADLKPVHALFPYAHEEYQLGVLGNVFPITFARFVIQINAILKAHKGYMLPVNRAFNSGENSIQISEGKGSVFAPAVEQYIAIVVIVEIVVHFDGIFDLARFSRAHDDCAFELLEKVVYGHGSNLGSALPFVPDRVKTFIAIAAVCIDAVIYGDLIASHKSAFVRFFYAGWESHAFQRAAFKGASSNFEQAIREIDRCQLRTALKRLCFNFKQAVRKFDRCQLCAVFKGKRFNMREHFGQL